MVYPIRTERDAKRAEWMLRLAYDQLGGTPEAEVVARVEAGGRDGDAG